MSSMRETREPQIDYLTTTEVSDRYRTSKETLRWWRQINAGPPSFNIGRRVFYRQSEVDHWFAQQEAATRRGGDAA
ncbi:helix-turn-helix transcriptional regulator [Rhodococcus cercidiphylli]|jgi:predicted DNA-binding transcriptional regulator AlpA|uniref:Helix-turn-helix domain-containing protein n=1 Tax=Rhodococcus cercidiphylli TaxID=489916 RepID=A0ABU4AXB4_9NOCA|nr:helix-turn-helix domain-containing protein [Rhodococcus cercidiphylli]MDV6230878.1 helix-turn-helix domain-containing protein [Rhodococcus cercidiphylli]